MVDFYDELIYETNPFPETHPNNLATLGLLFGIPTASPQQCRVLELGSATGGNLIPMAWHLPQSEFVGVELSETQVAIGQRIVSQLNLSNLHLEVGDILALDPAALGKFDYIIAHGVYSWVPPAVREKMLAVVRDCLTPHGLAYISYNLLPGWRMRGSLRDLLLHATREVKGADAKYRAAITALERLQRALTGAEADSQRYVQKEITYLLDAHPSYLLHEYLAGENNAFLFSEFLADTTRYDLQYVCETDLHTLFDTTLSGAAQAALADIEEPLQHEQWMDFVRMRAFRKSVLCRADVSLERAVDVDVFTGFFYSANLRLKGNANLSNTKPATFLTPDNTELTVVHPLSKAALLYAQEVHPYTPDFTELYHNAAAQVRDAGGGEFADARGELISEWFSLYSYRAVYAHLQPCLIHPVYTEYPKASALARLQVAEGWKSVATVRHQALSLDNFSSELLQRLDGTRTVDELIRLAQSNDQGSDSDISANVKRLLNVFARHGLLIN